MDDGGIPFILRLRGRGGPAERDQAERFDPFRQLERVLQDSDAFGNGVDTRPDSAETERVNGKQEVFGRRGRVLNPVFASLSGERLVERAADHDGDGRRGGHFRVRQAGAELFKQIAVFDHDESPRLLVFRRRGGHRRLQEEIDRLVGNGLVEERAHAGACHDGFDDGIFHEMTPFSAADLEDHVVRFDCGVVGEFNILFKKSHVSSSSRSFSLEISTYAMLYSENRVLFL